jgi:hypothetical protein
VAEGAAGAGSDPVPARFSKKGAVVPCAAPGLGARIARENPEGGETDLQGTKTMRWWMALKTVEANIDLLIGETKEERISDTHTTYPRSDCLRAAVA